MAEDEHTVDGSEMDISVTRAGASVAVVFMVADEASAIDLERIINLGLASGYLHYEAEPMGPPQRRS